MAGEQHRTRSVKRRREEHISEIVAAVQQQLNSVEADRSLTGPISKLSDLAKDQENVDLIIESGAVPTLVRCLQEHEVEGKSAYTLGLLASKDEYQRLIFLCGALPHLVALLKRHKHGQNTPEVNNVISNASYAITRLSHENVVIKRQVRDEGGIPPLVEILKSIDVKVSRVARALRALALKDDENKAEIMGCNALPILVLMLESKKVTIHYEAVALIGTLVHSSPAINNEVLHAGVLQPVIELLSSIRPATQREAASLLGEFAATDKSCKVAYTAEIVQRGALGPLVKMLHSSNDKLKERSSFVLGRLAQDHYNNHGNRAGIVNAGGVAPLLELLYSNNGALRRNGVFALSELAYCEDVIVDLIRFGGVQKLIEGDFNDRTRCYVEKTLKRLEKSIRVERVWKRLLSLMDGYDKTSQRQFALAFAMFCSTEDKKRVLAQKNGIVLLMEFLEQPHSKIRRRVCAALCELAEKVTSLSPVDVDVNEGEQYPISATDSYVTFEVEGKQFRARKTYLLASSDVFQVMLNGDFMEKDAMKIKIENIRWETFVSLMNYIHHEPVELSLALVPHLLIASDQYFIAGLKRLCVNTLVHCISDDNIEDMYKLSDESNAVSLRNACILFVLKKCQELDSMPWYDNFVKRILPEIRDYFVKILVPPLPQ